MAGTAVWTGPNAAQTDGNQNPTVMLAAGTLGTADTKGTAAPIRWGGNPLTNAGYVEILGTVTTTGGAGGGTTVTVDHGTITLSNPAGTTNNIATGTMQTLGTVGVLNSGTINSATVVLNSGTINVATVTLNSGTINVGTVVNNGGTVAVIQNAGTIATGANTIGNIGTLVAGTINSATAVLNSGTINVGTFVNNGGTVAVIQNAGTLQTGANTIGNIGTLLLGTVKLNPLPATFTITSGGTTSAGTIGTLVTAPSAGTTMYITGFHMLQVSGTAETVLSFGLQASGNQVLAHGSFPAGGGITEQKTFPSGYGATGTALTWNILSGSGTVDIHVDYFLV